jgi:hypothetical protein
MHAFIKHLIRSFEVNRTLAKQVIFSILCEEAVLKELAELAISSIRFDDRDRHLHFDFGCVKDGDWSPGTNEAPITSRYYAAY